MTPRPVPSTSPVPSRRRLRPALLALVAAIAVALPVAAASSGQAATPKPGSPSSSSSPSGAPSAQAPAKPSGPQVRWSVAPATADSLDAKRQFFDFAVQPGASFADHVAVTNYSAQPVEFHIYGADATTDYDTHKYALVSSTKRSVDLGSWVSVQGGPSSCPASASSATTADCLSKLGTRITVQPNTAVIVPFTITVPKNARPGDHSAGIVAAYTQGGNGKKSVTLEQRVGSRIYVRVAGPLRPELSTSGEVLTFHGGKNPFGGGGATVGFDLKDSGNTRVSAVPRFTVTGPFGIPIARAAAPVVENLLPGGVTHVQVEIPKGVPRLFLVFGGIEVHAQPADGTIKDDRLPADAHGTAVGWAVPWIWVLIVVLVAAGVVGGLWWRRRSQERLAIALQEYAQYLKSQNAEKELVLQAGDREPEQ
jgi:hypothetical protein